MQTNTVWLQFLQTSLTNPVGASVAAQILHLMLSLFSQSLVRYSKNCVGSAVCFCEWSTTAYSSDIGDAGACEAAVFLLAALLSLSDLLPATLSTAGVACSFFDIGSVCFVVESPLASAGVRCLGRKNGEGTLFVTLAVVLALCPGLLIVVLACCHRSCQHSLQAHLLHYTKFSCLVLVRILVC